MQPTITPTTTKPRTVRPSRPSQHTIVDNKPVELLFESHEMIDVGERPTIHYAQFWEDNEGRTEEEVSIDNKLAVLSGCLLLVVFFGIWLLA